MAGIRILVVEDDVAVRKIIQIALERDPMLKGWGLLVEAAVDGCEGLAMFQKEPPDMMIVDLLLPRMNGFALVEAVRGTPEGKDLPILITSDVYRDEKALQKMRDDFNVTVELKPFAPKKLAQIVLRMLKQANKLSRPKPATRSKAKAKPKDKAKPASKIGQVKVKQVKEKRPASDPRAPGTKRRDTPVPEVKRQGSLSDTTLAQLLLDGLEERYTGHVTITRDKVLKRIYMMMGYPVFVESNLRSETLGQMLVRRGGAHPGPASPGHGGCPGPEHQVRRGPGQPGHRQRSGGAQAPH